MGDNMFIVKTAILWIVISTIINGYLMTFPIPKFRKESIRLSIKLNEIIGSIYKTTGNVQDFQQRMCCDILE